MVVFTLLLKSSCFVNFLCLISTEKHGSERDDPGTETAQLNVLFPPARRADRTKTDRQTVSRKLSENVTLECKTFESWKVK